MLLIMFNAGFTCVSALFPVGLGLVSIPTLQLLFAYQFTYQISASSLSYFLGYEEWSKNLFKKKL